MQPDVTVHATGRVPLVVAVVVICALGVVNAVLYAHGGIRVVGIALCVLVAVAAYVLFWRPAIRIGAAGIRVVNPFRSVEIPWPQVTGVDQRGQLRVLTPSGAVSVWALPRASRAANLLGFRRTPNGLPDYEAEQAFEREPQNRSAADAVQRILQQRLDERAG